MKFIYKLCAALIIPTALVGLIVIAEREINGRHIKMHGIIELVIILLIFSLSVLFLSLIPRGEFQKTIFYSKGINNKKKNKLISWDEIVLIDVDFIKRKSFWQNPYYFVFIVKSKNDELQIAFTYIGEKKYLKKKFKEHCPREDLIQRLDEILNKKYIQNIKKTKLAKS